jgi:hypothetical protein
MNSPEPGIRNAELKTRLPKIIAIWFSLQVLLNVAITLYLTLHPPDEPVSWFGRADLTINTGINAALAIGFWRRTAWVWSTAVWLIPLYWALHAWHMVVPAEGLLLWPFLMVDALVLGWLLSAKGRQALDAPPDRWKGLSMIPAPMFALGLYALLAPVLGMFIAIAGAAAVLVVGWRRGNSRFQIPNSR